jgi:hypothetical protein
MTIPVSYVTIRVPLTIRSRPGRRTMVSLGFGAKDGRIVTMAHPTLLEGVPVGWAHRRERLLSGAPTRLTEREVRIET